MSLVLDITGKSLLDGTPQSLPQLPWALTYGGKAPDPGSATHYYADRKSGLLRLAQRPFNKFASTFTPIATYELDDPLERIGTSGIMLEEAATAGNIVDDWDVSSGSWTETNCSLAGGEESPTGETSGDGEGHLLTPTANGGSVNQAFTTATKMNADTYVFSVWVYKSADGPVSVAIDSGVSTNVKHFDLSAGWSRVWVTSANEDSTSADCFIYPGGSSAHPNVDQSTAIVWGPMLVNRNTTAGITGMPAGSTLLHTTSERISARWDATFPWPAPPWTLLVDFTPLWADETPVEFEMINAVNPAGTSIYRFYKDTSEQTAFDVLHVDGTTDTLVFDPTPLSYGPRTGPHRTIITLGTDGELHAWWDGADALSLSNVRVASSSTHLRLNHTTNGADIILHRLKVWDRVIDAQRLF